MIQDMASVQQQEGYFRDLVERLVHQFEGRAHYDDEMAIIREAREALAKTENVSTSVGHGDGVTVGNAAAMLKALKELVNHHCRNCPEDTQYGCGVNIGGLLGFKCTLLKQARAALAAPARNCDVYQNEDELLRFVCDKLHYEKYSFGWFAARKIIAILFATEGGRDA